MVMKIQDEELYDLWEKRWGDSKKRNKKLTFIGRLSRRAKIKVLSRAIKGLEIKTVIEVGCGLGHTQQVFHSAGFDCVGIDVSPYAVAVCKDKGLRSSLRKVEDITEQYSLVSSDGMLEHFLDFEPYAKHLMRISRRYVLLIQPNHDSFCGKTLAYLGGIIRRDKNVFEYNYRMKDFIAVFDRNGFKVVNNYPIFCDVLRLLLFERTR